MTTQKPEPVAVEQVTLNDCPPGLFMFGETMGFKSEYVTTLESPRRYQCDAYVVESGEYFHGGAVNSLARGQLLVAPIERARLTTDRSVGGEAGMVLVPLATMNAIHTELACGMAFLGRGPGGTNGDHIEKWASLCSEVADGLAKADALVRPIVHPKFAATPPVPAISGEGEKLRAYYKAVEEMVCVWRDTDTPSSMDEEAWEDPSEDDGRWAKFIAVRAALATPDAAPIGSDDVGAGA